MVDTSDVSPTAAAESLDNRLRANANGLVLFGLIPTGLLGLSIVVNHHWPSFSLGFRSGLVAVAAMLSASYLWRRASMKRVGHQEDSSWDSAVRDRGRRGIRRDLVALAACAVLVVASLAVDLPTLLGAAVALLLASAVELAFSIEASRS